MLKRTQFIIGKNPTFCFQGIEYTCKFFYFFLRKRICTVLDQEGNEWFSVKKVWIHQIRKTIKGSRYYIESSNGLEFNLLSNWDNNISRVSLGDHLLEYEEFGADFTSLYLNSILLGSIEYTIQGSLTEANLIVDLDKSSEHFSMYSLDIEEAFIKGFVLCLCADFIQSADTDILMDD